jgi:hypothetical protein
MLNATASTCAFSAPFEQICHQEIVELLPLLEPRISRRSLRSSCCLRRWVVLRGLQLSRLQLWQLQLWQLQLRLSWLPLALRRELKKAVPAEVRLVALSARSAVARAAWGETARIFGYEATAGSSNISTSMFSSCEPEETEMPEKKRGIQGRAPISTRRISTRQISMSEEQEVRYWTKALGVSRASPATSPAL